MVSELSEAVKAKERHVELGRYNLKDGAKVYCESICFCKFCGGDIYTINPEVCALSDLFCQLCGRRFAYSDEVGWKSS